MTTVLVCGATGNTGSEVLRQLRGEDVTLRALTRSKESAERLSAEGVQAFVGNLEEVAGLGPALDGVDVVYVANPASPELPALEGALAAAARDAGVGHLVKLSVIGAAADSPLSFAELHFHAEELIRQSGIGWTMLRPNGFMQNTLAWSAQIPGGVIYGPVMDARWSIIDVRDIGAVGAAAILDAAAHAGKTFAARAGRDRRRPARRAARGPGGHDRPGEGDDAVDGLARVERRADGRAVRDLRRGHRADDQRRRRGRHGKAGPNVWRVRGRPSRYLPRGRAGR